MAPLVAALTSSLSATAAKWLAGLILLLGLVAWALTERAGRHAALADAAGERAYRLIAEQAAEENAGTARRLADLYVADQDRATAALAAERARSAKIQTIVKEVTSAVPVPEACPDVGPAVAAALDGLRRLRAGADPAHDRSP